MLLRLALALAPTLSTGPLPAAPADRLHPSIAALEPFLGEWELDATWSHGATVEARASYAPILGGRFVLVSTLVSDGGGPVYERYQGVLGAPLDPEQDAGHLRAWTVQVDGSLAVQDYAVREDGALLVEWSAGGATVNEVVGPVTRDPAGAGVLQPWRVAMGETVMLDADWRRAEGPEPAWEPRPLAPALAAFEPLLGDFRGRREEAPGSEGGPAEGAAKEPVRVRRLARATGAGTAIAVRTWAASARAGGAPVEERFAFLYPHDEPDRWRELRFEPDGGVSEHVLESDPSGLVSREELDGLTLERRWTPDGPDGCLELVRARAAGTDAGAWTLRSEAIYELRGSVPRRPIDHALFVASGPGVRSFELEQNVPATPAEVFAALTDEASYLRLFGPRNAALDAHIDLAIGGAYEWLFDGETGSNGCQILSYVPDRMVSFTWNTPPENGALRELRTWVVIELETLDDGTRVRLTHLGFGQGPEWDRVVEYFRGAWTWVLGELAGTLEERRSAR